MRIEIDSVKGFKDYLPPESLKRDAIKKVIEKWYKLYGFVPIETPLIEFEEFMRPESIVSEEDEALSNRFKLRDRAGRNLGIRHEFTFQLARVIKQNPNLKLPLRRYQIGPVFRDEPVGEGKQREFVQCDLDILGDSTTDADAECLAVVSKIMKELDIDFNVEINNRRLLQGIIESVQLQSPQAVMRELGKINKLGADMIKSNLKKYGDANQIVTLFKLLEKDIDFFVSNAFEGAKEVFELIKKCKKNNIDAEFSPFLIRGPIYYTGNVFEVKSQGKLSLAAGGRYDKSIGKYIDKEIPAVGISLGLERVMDVGRIELNPTKAIIVSVKQDLESERLAKRLRKENISCMLSKEETTKAIEHANAYTIPNVLVINEEIKKGRLKVINALTSEEKIMTEKQFVKILNS